MGFVLYEDKMLFFSMNESICYTVYSQTCIKRSPLGQRKLVF